MRNRDRRETLVHFFYPCPILAIDPGFRGGAVGIPPRAHFAAIDPGFLGGAVDSPPGLL